MLVFGLLEAFYGVKMASWLKRKNHPKIKVQTKNCIFANIFICSLK
jgi:hypothetical protein